MMGEPRFSRTEVLARTVRPLIEFVTQSAWAQRRDDPDIADFTFGNPHEMPLPGYVDALQRWAVPQHKKRWREERRRSR